MKQTLKHTSVEDEINFHGTLYPYKDTFVIVLLLRLYNFEIRN